MSTLQNNSATGERYRWLGETESVTEEGYTAQNNRYGSRGVTLYLTGSMNLGYTGKPYDASTGLYNYGYRDYKPQAARFTTPDPIRDGNNWFSYVNNDPVNFIDLWGLQANDTQTANHPNDVLAINPGTVFRSGWQDPNNENVGLGWRTSILRDDGFYDQYGHLDPTSTLQDGTRVEAGDVVGRIADPSNGYTTAPHLHFETRESNTGIPVNPGIGFPFRGGSEITSPYNAEEEGLRTEPHQGVDYVPIR